MLETAGFTDVVIGPAVDTFGGASGEDNARAFEVYGYALHGDQAERLMRVAAVEPVQFTRQICLVVPGELPGDRELARGQRVGQHPGQW